MARQAKNKVEEQPITPVEATDEIEVVEFKSEPVKEEPKKSKRTLEPTTLVTVMSNVVGGLNCHSLYTGKGFRIDGYGKLKRIQLQDLENLYSEQPALIEQGMLVILDQDVVEHLYLQELYESIVTPKELDRFLQLSEDEITERLENAPFGIKHTLAKVIKQKIQNGDSSLKSISRVKFFEQILGVNFDL
jgi:hypothetical protein